MISENMIEAIFPKTGKCIDCGKTVKLPESECLK